MAEPADPRGETIAHRPASANDPSLVLRVASAVVFLPLLVLMARVGGLLWLGFALLMIGLALREFYSMMASKGLAPHWKSGFVAAFLFPIGNYARLRTHRTEEWHLAGLLTVLLVAMLLAELRRGASKQTLVNVSSTLLGVLYIGWLGSHVAALRELPWSVHVPYALGMSFALLPFFLAWTCDTAAYLVGRAWGRHKLAPSVSPQKSVEGAMGGLLASVAAGAVARLWFAPYLSWGAALSLGALVGVFAQLGDLVESLLKRDAETKESSSLIPGHGGVLDRFDSLLFAAPLVYYFLVWEVFRR
ncbi:MAG TPA: phosphatidate cytidylyltransferase [Candidatus Limnocylindrales bacterium]|nr:phosphatidate cytidylyltransferase [Candidatus Limnocylindrales bacterium]